MLFDLKRYLAAGEAPYQAELAVDLRGRSFAGAVIPQPVQAVFTAERAGGGAQLTLRGSAEAVGECARCLDPVSLRADVDATWFVREKDLEDPDFELPLEEKSKLDVDEWLFQELLFQIPTVLLCDPDCEGLCPECGQKKAVCTCKKTAGPGGTVDARLSILKTLLE